MKLAYFSIWITVSTSFLFYGICLPGPSFNDSLGYHDSYMRPHFLEFFDTVHTAKRGWDRFLHPYTGTEAYIIFKNLYEQYYVEEKLSSSDVEIPKIIHQIWIGPNQIPEKYRRFQSTWNSIPGWRYKLWTEDEINALPLVNRALYDQEKNYAARADIVRLEILCKEGGLYVDMDFECIRPECFEKLHSMCDFYCGISPLDCHGLFLNNAIIGSIPNHPILELAIRQFKNLVNTLKKTNRTVEDTILVKGPGLLTKAFLEHAACGGKNIALPPSFFYPLGLFQLQNDINFARLQLTNDLATIRALLIKPETMAIHWWAHSWFKD